MGVRGLQTYAENHCQNVCHTVSIAQMAADYRRRYHSSQPTIVVDGMSLLNRLYGRTLEWIYGGQWVQFCAILEDFVQRFEKLGVKLVFFFDGRVEPTKRAEWVERRMKKMRDIVEVFMYIKEHRQQPPTQNIILPASMGSLTRFIFKFRIGAEVYSTTREADVEIAEFAKTHDSVFAILGQDSDFMIFDTKPYLSVAHLDLEQMTTILYDRRALAYNLSLSVPMLPLFSCMMGNDIIPVDLLRPFHRSIRQAARAGYGTQSGFATTAPLVGELINSNCWTGNFNNQAELTTIAGVVLGDARNSHLLHDALKSYHLSTIPRKCANLIEKKHIECEMSPTVYNMLCHMEYESSELLEDSENQGIPPGALIYRPLSRRMYSILFSGKPNSIIKEWSAYWGNPLKGPECVSPQPIRIRRTCTLSELWSNLPEFQDAKLEHFLGCLESTFSVRDLLQVPRRYAVLVSILNYLLTFDPTLLRPWEVVVFLVQAVSLANTDLSYLYNLKVPWVDARAVNLASILMRGVAVFVTLLGACGYPFALSDAMPWNYFDGKLFHDTYIRATKNPRIESLCKSQDEVLQVNHLFSIVTQGTLMETVSLLPRRE